MRFSKFGEMGGCHLVQNQFFGRASKLCMNLGTCLSIMLVKFWGLTIDEFCTAEWKGSNPSKKSHSCNDHLKNHNFSNYRPNTKYLVSLCWFTPHLVRETVWYWIHVEFLVLKLHFYASMVCYRSDQSVTGVTGPLQEWRGVLK